MNRALQWKLIAGFILVFVAGGISGAFLGGLYVQHHFFQLHHPQLIGISQSLRGLFASSGGEGAVFEPPFPTQSCRSRRVFYVLPVPPFWPRSLRMDSPFSSMRWAL